MSQELKGQGNERIIYMDIEANKTFDRSDDGEPDSDE